MARDWMTCTALNTGNPGSLNTLDGAVLSDGDGALTLMDGVAYRHRLNATSGAAESSPLIIKPLYNAGNKRWELVEWYVPDATNAMSAMNRQSADARYAPIANGVTNGNSHDHNGGDGGQIDHVNLANKGTNTHASIDGFISSKAAANGLASLNASSKVVQNPASSASTPAASKIPIADANGQLNDWVDLQRVMVVGSGQFNSLAGVTIALPTEVASTDEYSVFMNKLADSGFVGDIWVDKATTGFTVYNAGSDAETYFEYVVLYQKRSS